MLALLLCAAAVSSPHDWKISAESDPVDFVSHGYALYVGVKPPGLERWRFGLGTFALDFPGFAIDALAGESGWSVRAKWSALAYVSHYFNDERRGFFVGGRTFVSEFRYRNSAFPGAEDNQLHLFVAPEVGYQWFPFDNGFYVTPWLGLGVDVARSGVPRVGDKELNGARLLPLPFVYFGYELSL
jgi:hypothetical protein